MAPCRQYVQDGSAGPGVARFDCPMLRYLESLRSWQLLLLAGALLFADLLIPDPIPFLDELLLGVITYALARWKKPPA